MGPTVCICLSILWVCGGAYTHTNVYVLVGYVHVLSDHCGHYSQNSLYMTPANGAVAIVFTI